MRLSGEYPLQFIIVTGDIAFSGQSREYDIASEFFVSLARELGLDPQRISIVPGNHDVDRSLQTYMHQGVRFALTNQQTVDDFLSRKAERVQLMERQSAFCQFRDGLVAFSSVEETEDGLARVRLFDTNGLRICVLELNSAWLSGSNDQPGNLLIGERQVIGALALADQHRPHLTVASSHHPTDWLAEFDQLSCHNRLDPQIDIFHHGHIHRHQASVMLLPDSECLHLGAGSSHETRHYRNSYNLVEYDVGNAICRIRQFEYIVDSGSFQEMSAKQYELPSTREFPATATEVASMLRSTVEMSEPYSNYMAALLTGDLNEVPILLNERSATFATSSLSNEYHFPEVLNFLRISNLLRVYDTVPLSNTNPV